jgi:hypothetical protein
MIIIIFSCSGEEDEDELGKGTAGCPFLFLSLFRQMELFILLFNYFLVLVSYRKNKNLCLFLNFKDAPPMQYSDQCFPDL